MTAPLPASAAAMPGLPLPSAPIAFDGLFGWFSPGLARRGVVLCGTQGFEQLSAHRAWRALAEKIAATGCATLRFDYPGEGDSTDEGASSLAAWTGAIGCAARYLRESAGCEEVVLVGLRLGAALAALAAAEAGVDELVMLAPVALGRAWLREMKLQSRAVGRLPDGTPLPQEPETIAVGGFRLDPALAGDVSRIDLAAAQAAPAGKILIIGAEATLLPARYRALGAAVETAPFPGLTALLANPLFAEEPREAFAAALAFATGTTRPALDRPLPLAPSPPIVEACWREAPLRFGAGLFGILCRPIAAPAGRPVVLFVNAGTNVHSGWGRQTTALARRLAQDGVASLRIDLGGVGDSPDRPGGATPLYNLACLDDLAAAIDALAALGEGPVVLVGACSGAYLAFNAACHDARVKGALIVNLYRFDWRAEDDLETVLRGAVRGTATYVALIARRDVWRRALKGEIHFAAIAAALTRRARGQVSSRLRRLIESARGTSVAARIAALRRRGAHLRIVYSAGDPGLAELHGQLGRSPTRIERRLGAPVAIIANADHDLSTRAAQEALHAELTSLIGTVAPRA